MRLAILCLSAVASIAGSTESVKAQGSARDSLGGTASSDHLTIATDSSIRQSDPGTSLTIRLVIVNDGSSRRVVETKTALPDGWRLLSGPAVDTIDPGAKVLRFVQCAIARDAAAGEYQIVESVRSSGLEQDLRIQATVAVRAKRLILVQLLHEPLFVSGGSTYRAVFLVSNRGNVQTRVKLAARSERQLPARVDTLTELKPGESREVGVTVNTEDVLRTDATTHHVTLQADVDGGMSGDGNVIPQAMAGTQVIPKSDGGSTWYNMPFRFMVNSQSSSSRSLTEFTSRSFELTSSASISEGGASIVDVVARGSQLDHSLFSLRDEYRLGIANPRFTIQLGDQVFSQSPLSLTGLVGSGASAKLSLGRWRTGFSTGLDRWIPGATLERAAFVGMQFNDHWNLSGNAVQSSQFGGITRATVYARFTPSLHEVVEVERGARLGGVAAGATLLRASGQRGRLTFDLHHQTADSGYQSGLGATREDWASLTYRPYTLLRLNARLDDRVTTGIPVPFGGGFFPAPRRMGTTATLGMDVGSYLSAGVRSYAGHQDNSALSPFHGADAERSGWARFRARLLGVTVSSAVERGTSDDPLGGRRRAFSASTFQAEAPLFSHASVTAFVDRSTGLRRGASVAEEIVTVGGSGQLQIGKLSASAAVAGTPAFLRPQLPDSLQPGLAWLDGTLAYQFSPGRALAFRVRSMSAGIRMPNSTSARISYSLPLSLPVGRSRTSSRVVGRVYDAETGIGIANALVRVGDHSALTDEDGRIAIGGMSPDRYPVYVDLGTRQASGLGFQEPSMQVSTRAGHTSELSMGVVRMGRIRGHLQLFELLDVPRLLGDSVRQQKKGGLRGAIVSLVNGAEERRVVSDSAGWFELRDARPGTWRIIVSSAELPAQHYVEGDSIRVIDVVPGGTPSVEMNVRPRQRRILPLDAVPSVPSATSPNGGSTGRERTVPPALRDSAQVAHPRSLQSTEGPTVPRDVPAPGGMETRAPFQRTMPSTQRRTSTALRISVAPPAKARTQITLASYASGWEIGLARVTGGNN